MFYNSFKDTSDVNADNVKAYTIAQLETQIAHLDREIADSKLFVARQQASIAYELERYGRETPDATLTQWIANSEDCQREDTKRRLVCQTMLDALLAS